MDKINIRPNWVPITDESLDHMFVIHQNISDPDQLIFWKIYSDYDKTLEEPPRAVTRGRSLGDCPEQRIYLKKCFSYWALLPRLTTSSKIFNYLSPDSNL